MLFVFIRARATTHVLSEYNILHRRSETLHASFTYIIKSNKPKIDPCGTPQVRFDVLDI